MATAQKETPLMAQYNAIKQQYPDAILLFRVGDFYETFGADAIHAAEVLGIVLTKRANGSASHIELAGFPHHSLEVYLPKLVKAGLRVAICDQLEDPKSVKGIVKRGVTELVSPGLTTSLSVLQPNSNNFIAAVWSGNSVFSLACLDISTGEFQVTEGSQEEICNVIGSLQPAEILISRAQIGFLQESIGKHFIYRQLEDWIFALDFARDILLQHFKVETVKGFGIEEFGGAQICGGVILHYLHQNKLENLGHIQSIRLFTPEHFVWLDPFSIRNLELLESYQPNGSSLLQVIRNTYTACGARLLRKWLLYPLKQLDQIQFRHTCVEAFIQWPESEWHLPSLKKFPDLERFIAKLALRKIQPRELLALADAIEISIQLHANLIASDSIHIKRLGENLPVLESVQKEIQSSILAEAPALLIKGEVIAAGINADLDEFRHIRSHAKQLLADLQATEIQNTGISSLKVGYTNVFGYYLEVTNVHKSKVPTTWIRKQTLTGAERYITPELKVLEEKILAADTSILTIEIQEFEKLVESLQTSISKAKLLSERIAEIDVLYGFARLAIERQYVKPKMQEGTDLLIVEGRHPVIEYTLPIGTPYIPNTVQLDSTQNQILMITGPNMSGKSAVLRQTALIVILAQIGSFVPAQSATIGIVDKIFTRVGASDNVSAGESTFMVEMLETAGIMHNITSKSLVLLDEIGRGTSTYDGISIAWSIAEFLHSIGPNRPKTLFATHYHELNALASKHERIQNFHIEVRDTGNKVVFLRKLIPGASNHSFGIHVAEMAGMPNAIVQRSRQILKTLEANHSRENQTQIVESIPEPVQTLFPMPTDVAQQLKSEILHLQLDTISPIDALMKLIEFQQKAKKG